MTFDQIAAEVDRLLGNTPLRAYEQEGRIFLGDGVHVVAELAERTLEELQEVLYDWAVFAGYTNEDFEDFIE